MTKDEVKALLTMIDATYSTFKVEDASATLKAWAFLLEDQNAADINMAFKTYVNTSGSPYAPSTSELIALARKPYELLQMGEGEAWDIVRKAIGRSGWYAEEEFAKLPVECQRAVGSPSQLRTWAIDDNFNESVVMSNFQRSYRAVLQKEKEFDLLPAELRKAMLEYKGITPVVEVNSHTAIESWED